MPGFTHEPLLPVLMTASSHWACSIVHVLLLACRGVGNLLTDASNVRVHAVDLAWAELAGIRFTKVCTCESHVC
jgi:hypothetical protein